jgi:hypothetical protein
VFASAVQTEARGDASASVERFLSAEGEGVAYYDSGRQQAELSFDCSCRRGIKWSRYQEIMRRE